MQIFLSGASGVLGSVLAPELTRGGELTCLVRRRRTGVTGALELAGDLALPRLGLAAHDYADLSARTDVIVHCAAMTSFSNRPELARQVNAEGTNRMLELATRSGARLVHVSTAFVARIAEFADSDGSNMRSPSHYLRTKVEAEAMVSGSGLDATIVRPSILMGDSVSGEIAQFQGWHAMCEAIMTDRTPFLPADGQALIDSVPVDFVARAVAALAFDANSNGEWWLTAGADACTLDAALDGCLAIAAERGLAPHRPRTLPREMIERLVLPAFGDQVPRELRRSMLEGLELMRLFGSQHAFPRHWPYGLQPTPADLARCFEASLRFLCELQGIAAAREVA